MCAINITEQEIRNINKYLTYKRKNRPKDTYTKLTKIVEFFFLIFKMVTYYTYVINLC